MTVCKHATRQSPIYWCIFDLPTKETELAKLQTEAEKSDLWTDPQSAQHLMKKLSTLRDEVEGWHKLSKRVNDTRDLAEMDEESLRPELEDEINQIEEEVKRLELAVLLSGPYAAGMRYWK